MHLANVISLLFNFWYGSGVMWLITILGDWLYNDKGAANKNYWARNATNAAAFFTYGLEATKDAVSPSRLKFAVYGWLALLALVIASTVQTQNLPDREGDKARGRHTMPLILGELETRWTVAVSAALTTAYNSANFSLIPVGIGRHETLIACEVVYIFAIAFFKASMLFLLDRIFPGKKFQRILIAIGVFITAYSITQAVCAVFECTPRAEHRNGFSHPIFTDAEALAAQDLQRPGGSLTAIFATGSLVCIISIVRITKLKEVSLIDPSYSGVGGLVWSTLEQAFGTLSACLPTYRPLIHHWRTRRSTRASTDNTNVLHNSNRDTSSRKRLANFVGDNTSPFAKLEDTSPETSDNEWKTYCHAMGRAMTDPVMCKIDGFLAS
ncbi:MAG: hypothetical protein L6R37_008207 [Teloschistes peruensis]|nr:MAG: hypothetical protein L6R37_008207 [Teloschistes peruensis]